MKLRLCAGEGKIVRDGLVQKTKVASITVCALILLMAGAPSASLANDAARSFKIRDPKTGRVVLQQGQPFTTRHDNFADGQCQYLCTGVHEEYHRRQCVYFTAIGKDLTHAQFEYPAYGEELKCLQSAQRNGYLDIRSSPPGRVDY